MRFGRMFLAGDASHIVPPTGAKGSTSPPATCIISRSAFREYYDEKSSAGIDGYSATALARVWKAVRFSWWMTSMLHKFPDQGEFGARDPDRGAGLSRQLDRRHRRHCRRIMSGCRFERLHRHTREGGHGVTFERAND